MHHDALWRALEEARSNTDALFDCLCPGALYERPIPERHRIVFYIGHLEAFDWNLLVRHALDLPSFHPSFDRLFAFGIDPGSNDLPADQPSDWPRIEEVRRYNARVRAELDRRLADAPEQMLHVAIEHRLMHSETFGYMLHNLPYNQKVGPRSHRSVTGASPARELMDVPAQRVRLGRETRDGFGQDNEFEAHSVDVGPFAISKYKVTNGEYREFVDAGVASPQFWVRRGGEWWCRGMFEEFPLPLDWPVYVTWEEATAYAAWKGARLPAEAEWHAAAARMSADPERDNFDFQRWDPVPVAPGQMTGNGWEWTSTPFAPFPGFKPFPFYPGYSADFFDGQHYVLKGASPRTAARLARPSFRNWFRPAYPYIYAGFRLVVS